MSALKPTAEHTPFFDAGFLDVYTGGDTAIRDQILELFLDQATKLLERLEASRGDARAWHDAAHSLKGCASGVGATGLAEVARHAELEGSEGSEAQHQMMRSLRQALATTADMMRALIAH